MIILACYSLMILHPGPTFGSPDATKDDIDSEAGYAERNVTGNAESRKNIGGTL